MNRVVGVDMGAAGALALLTQSGDLVAVQRRSISSKSFPQREGSMTLLNPPFPRARTLSQMESTL